MHKETKGDVIPICVRGSEHPPCPVESLATNQEIESVTFDYLRAKLIDTQAQSDNMSMLFYKDNSILEELDIIYELEAAWQRTLAAKRQQSTRTGNQPWIKIRK